MGIMGWFFLNINSVGNSFKEDIRLSAYLRTLNKDTIGQIQQFIAAKPYAKDVVYVDKNSAKQIWNKENNEDWAKILDVNPSTHSRSYQASVLSTRVKLVKGFVLNNEANKLSCENPF